jgi:hypothetical protein
MPFDYVSVVKDGLSCTIFEKIAVNAELSQK